MIKKILLVLNINNRYSCQILINLNFLDRFFENNQM